MSIKISTEGCFLLFFLIFSTENLLVVLGADIPSFSIKVDLSFRYTPNVSELGYLHDLIGEDYLESIIRPEIRSVTREVIGEYLPEELYSTKREEVEDKIYEITSKSIADKYIFLDAILIRDVTLPQTLQAAIENKLRQEQEALEYEFKLLKESKEAERKRH